ncbi:MAG: AAC(3) family N-acetyltransferase [Candidatus Eremiobacteraeota bacterium]|nr:AAC(3) family N-acetyltransferase [Candidatus Eremiobacteraeota bacterium]MCW5870980.1 AAC(3) family N-acetyltransferase [Candidatus Eremiobacteraeota bacterium]
MNSLHRLLERLEVPVGGLVYLHTSFSRLRYLELSPNEFIDSLLDYLGPQGSLTMPSFSWNVDPSERPWKGYADYFHGHYVFDVRNTPANIGAVPELFRQRPGVRRGLNYWWSVAACGPLADELTHAQEEVEHPAGPDSSFGRIQHHGGWILGLGVTLNTTSLAFLPDFALQNRYFVTPEPLRGPVIDEQGRQLETWSYWVLPESVRYIRPEAVCGQGFEAMRRCDHEGVIQFAYPYAAYHERALSFGLPSPWWEALP